MVNCAGLSGRGALLLVTAPAQTKKGPQELVTEIDRWLVVYASLNGCKNVLARYKVEGLKFLNKKLQERRMELQQLSLPEE